MPTAEDLLDQYLGRVVPSSFNAGIIALSYIVSLVGAGSTLELIHRRTSHKGSYNHLLLVGAAISMGGVAIWSMHFIGNRAINILDGEPELQIVYSTGLTAASFFVPIIVLLLAFLAVSRHSEIKWWRILLSGSLSGGAICGMHYLGDKSISNYRCTYATANVVGAGVIAVVASSTALALFFVFRAAWTSSWWRRVGIANVLAGAVSGMHWCAATGTSYVLLHLDHSGKDMSQTQTITVVICLSAGACLIMAGSAIYSARVRKGYANKAQQIVLAAAVFDNRGRILVSPEGLLPSEKVTDTFPQRSDNDIFDTAHPLFHWMFRASRNWPSVTNLINRMANHLADLTHGGRSGRMGIKLINEHGELIDNYDTVFRELFCLAAAALAAKMKESLLEAGVLWDEIFATGASARIQMDFVDVENSKRSFLQKITGTKKAQDITDLTEKGQKLQEYGRGSLMFLVRHVDNTRDIDRLEAAGYQFAELHQVVSIIGSSMQIKTPTLEKRLREMSTPTGDKMTLRSGVHLGVFGVRARVDSHGFDVLVKKEARSLLPTVELPLEQLEPWQTDFLRQLGRLPISTLLQRLYRMAGRSQSEAQFAFELLTAIFKLRALMDFPAFDDAILASKVVQVPCSPPDGNPRATTCPLITIRLVFPIHADVNNPNFEFIPLLLFKTQQMVNKNSPHHAAFSRSVHREISPLLNSLPSEPSGPSGSFTSHGKLTTHLRELPVLSAFHRLAHPRTTSRNSTADGTRGSTSESQSELQIVASNSSSSSIKPFSRGSLERGTGSPSIDDESTFEKPIAIPAERQRQLQLSGIMVSQEVTVDVQEATNDVDMRTDPAHSRTTTVGPRRMSQANTGDDKLEPEISARNHGSGGTKTIISGINVGMTNVEIGTEDEARTFVDELLVLCVE